MLSGRPTVFLSCSERFEVDVALPVRDGLEELGVFGVIVSDEPLLPHTDSSPDAKVESYLDASDAFVALCTADDEMMDGVVRPRPNIVEYQRAKQKPHLRQRIQVFKQAAVELPSNVNPVHEPLELDNAEAVVGQIAKQLESWGVVAATPRGSHSSADRSAHPPPPEIAALIDGLELGDHDEATRRIYELARNRDRDRTVATVMALMRYLEQGAASEEVHPLCSLLEAANRLDPALVGPEIIERLVESEDFSQRSAAAMILWDLAEAAPGLVPLAVLGKLARPNSEDWYVEAPAMAAVKLLMLRRRAARVIFDGLAASEDAQDRYSVATSLIELARIDDWAVPRDLAERLDNDPDPLVADKGRELIEALPDRSEHAIDPLSPFGL